MKDDKHWSREEFVKRFGNYQIEPGTPAMIANYGPGYRTIERSQMSLRGYLDQMRTTAGTPGELFVSAPVNPPLLGAVKALMQQPGPEDWFYADGNTHEVLLSVGGAKRGLPMHAHEASWLLQLRGSKKWYLYPSELNATFIPEAFYWELFTVTPNRWSTDLIEWIYSGKPQAPLTCILKPGELLLLPAGWHHATENMGESLSVGGQLFGLTATEEQLMAIFDATVPDILSPHQLVSEANLLWSWRRDHGHNFELEFAAGIAQAASERLQRSLRLEPGQMRVACLLIETRASTGELQAAMETMMQAMGDCAQLLRDGFYSEAEYSVYSTQLASSLQLAIESVAPGEFSRLKVNKRPVAEFLLNIYERAVGMLPRGSFLTWVRGLSLRLSKLSSSPRRLDL
eukprot:TRINITY_DN4543_c0_g1_i1.p1 TRINITY_DN4543_c0_g1~~TRINITY_DN4543_c0_g1_i1.p1  ORF type:complete len:400 (+),score=99.35 TRINITY_DN4543_c0_g1_i1:277-1476(+)